MRSEKITHCDSSTNGAYEDELQNNPSEELHSAVPTTVSLSSCMNMNDFSWQTLNGSWQLTQKLLVANYLGLQVAIRVVLSFIYLQETSARSHWEYDREHACDE